MRHHGKTAVALGWVMVFLGGWVVFNLVNSPRIDSPNSDGANGGKALSNAHRSPASPQGNWDNSTLVYGDPTAGWLPRRDQRADTLVVQELQRLQSFYDNFQPDLIVHNTGDNEGYVTRTNQTPVSTCGSRLNPIPYPHVCALNLAGARRERRRVLLRRGLTGRYKAFKIIPGGSGAPTVSNWNTTPDTPVILMGELNSALKPNVRIYQDIGGDDALIVKASHFRVHRLIFSGTRSSIFIGGQGDVSNGNTTKRQNLYFADNVIDGRYDWLTQTGVSSLWGIHTFAMANVRFVRNTFENIKKEHAIYAHNNRGKVSYMANTFREVGRTAVQNVARTSEGNSGYIERNPHMIEFLNNLIIDIGNADDCAGASAITIGARNDKAYIANNVDRRGYDDHTQGLAQALEDFCGQSTSQPPYTGSYVTSTSEKEDWETSHGPFVVRNNRFDFADRYGDRTIVGAHAVDEIVFTDNWLKTGHNPNAIIAGIPGDAGKPGPTRYCFKRNLFNAGANTSANFTINGVPQSTTTAVSGGGLDCASL